MIGRRDRGLPGQAGNYNLDDPGSEVHVEAEVRAAGRRGLIYGLTGAAAGTFVGVWAILDITEKLAEGGLGVVAQVVRLLTMGGV